MNDSTSDYKTGESFSSAKEFLCLTEIRDMASIALADIEAMEQQAAIWVDAHNTAEALGRKHYPTVKSLRSRGQDHDRFTQALLTSGNAQGEFFRLLEGVLGVFGRISLLIFPQGETREAVRRARGTSLRRALEIEETHPIGNRAFRNKWLHFDEVLDQLPAGDHFVAQRFQHSATVSEATEKNTIRLLLVDKLEVRYLGIGSFRVTDLRDALIDIRARALTAIGSWAKRRNVVAPCS
jgi:hypothetical protein